MVPEDIIKKQIQLINTALNNYLVFDKKCPKVIQDAMNYSLFAGGKRLRPLLCLGAIEAAGGSYEKAMPVACALELIHTYSLIHDDLPSLDNDDLRRGKLTNHKVFGEDMAILAGDGLLTYAFELLTYIDDDIPSKLIVRVIREIASAAGVNGMIGGQVVDLKSQGSKANKEIIDYIHRNKTGALIRASVRSGCILAEAEEETLNRLTNYAEKLGLAFQIIDDWLDETGDEKSLGKRVGSDRSLNKATYTSLMGNEASFNEAIQLYDSAVKELEPLKEKGKVLEFLAKKLVYRKA